MSSMLSPSEQLVAERLSQRLGGAAPSGLRASEPASAPTNRIAAAKVVVIAVAFLISRHRSQA